MGYLTGQAPTPLVASGSLSPIATRAVRAVLATSPVSGTAPLTVNFNAAGSQAVAGIASYAFDFNGDGVFDQTGTAPTASFAYAKPGRYKVTLRVTDTEGDSDVTSQIVTVAASAPTVSGVGLAARAFRAKQGTTLKLTLSQPATVTVLIVAKRHTVRGKTARLTFKGVQGRNSFKLRVPSLPPGGYVATVTARGQTGLVSTTSTFSFTIEKAKKKS